MASRPSYGPQKQLSPPPKNRTPSEEEKTPEHGKKWVSNNSSYQGGGEGVQRKNTSQGRRKNHQKPTGLRKAMSVTHILLQT